jgi:hypothetical protein
LIQSSRRHSEHYNSITLVLEISPFLLLKKRFEKMPRMSTETPLSIIRFAILLVIGLSSVCGESELYRSNAKSVDTVTASYGKHIDVLQRVLASSSTSGTEDIFDGGGYEQGPDAEVYVSVVSNTLVPVATLAPSMGILSTLSPSTPFHQPLADDSSSPLRSPAAAPATTKSVPAETPVPSISPTGAPPVIPPNAMGILPTILFSLSPALAEKTDDLSRPNFSPGGASSFADMVYGSEMNQMAMEGFTVNENDKIISFRLSVAVLLEDDNGSAVASMPRSDTHMIAYVEYNEDDELYDFVGEALQITFEKVLAYGLDIKVPNGILRMGNLTEDGGPWDQSSLTWLSRRPSKPKNNFHLIQGDVELKSNFLSPVRVGGSLAEVHWIEARLIYAVRQNLFGGDSYRPSQRQSGGDRPAINMTEINQVIWAEIVMDLLDGTLLESLQAVNSQIVGASRVGDELVTDLVISGQLQLASMSQLDLSDWSPRQTLGSLLFALTFVGTTLLCVASDRRKKREERDMLEWSAIMGNESGVDELLRRSNAVYSRKVSTSPTVSGRSNLGSSASHVSGLESVQEII